MPDDEREVLTEKEAIELKSSGSSQVLRVPAQWRKSLPSLKGARLFEATVERDKAGGIFIIFRKVPPIKLDQARKQEEVNEE